MSHSAILVLIIFVLAPAFGSAQVESSLYLLRIEHTSFESHVCVLLQKTEQHAVNVSVEAAPAISGGDTSTPVSLLVGYQYL